jgi:hypothetical protein
MAGTSTTDTYSAGCASKQESTESLASRVQQCRYVPAPAKRPVAPTAVACTIADIYWAVHKTCSVISSENCATTHNARFSLAWSSAHKASREVCRSDKFTIKSSEPPPGQVRSQPVQARIFSPGCAAPALPPRGIVHCVRGGCVRIRDTAHSEARDTHASQRTRLTRRAPQARILHAGCILNTHTTAGPVVMTEGDTTRPSGQ